MKLLIRLCLFLIVACVIPLAALSAGPASVTLLNSADFNNAIASANQQNLPSPPQYNCGNTNAPISTPNPTAAAPPASPIYYAPPITHNVTPPPAPLVSPQSNNSGILLGSGTNNSTDFIIH